MKGQIQKYGDEIVSNALFSLVETEMFAPRPAHFVKRCEEKAIEARELENQRAQQRERDERNTEGDLSESDKQEIRAEFQKLADKLGIAPKGEHK